MIYTIADADVESTADGSSFLHLEMLPVQKGKVEYRTICLQHKQPDVQSDGQMELAMLVRAVFGDRHELKSDEELHGRQVGMRRKGRQVEWYTAVGDHQARAFFEKRKAA